MTVLLNLLVRPRADLLSKGFSALVSEETPYDDLDIPGVIRIVGLRDRKYEDRAAWLRGWLSAQQAHVYDLDDSRLLSQAHARFDAFLIHGDDRRRMCRIIRGWRQVLRSKAIFAALPSSSPLDRVELLRAGADTVLDVLAPSLVAAAQAKSVLTRIRDAQVQVERGLIIKTRAPLSRGEKIILDAVLGGAVIPHAALLTLLGKRPNTNAMASLRVRVYYLNAKLVNAAIKIRRNQGIVLEYGAQSTGGCRDAFDGANPQSTLAKSNKTLVACDQA